MPYQPASSRAFRASGFTLIEVMLALAIVLVLMIGINLVFKRTSEAISSGHALNELTRNARAASPIFFEDFRNCASDSPVFVITSTLVSQYRNAADAKAAAGIPGTGCVVDNSHHRLDTVSFLARGDYTRKTPESGYILSTTHSGEAFIRYGHVALLASNGTSYVNPDNSSGYMYASDWALGKNVAVLGNAQTTQYNAAPIIAVPNAEFPDATNYETFYAPSNATIAFPAPGNGAASMTNLSPLTAWTPPYRPAPPALASQDVFGTSRYDLAGVTLEQFRSTVTDAVHMQSLFPAATALAANQIPFYWWQGLVYNGGFKNTYTAGPAAYPYAPQVTTGTSVNRFYAQNALSAHPYSALTASNEIAGLSPIMLEHCSQFIVEFAGDFVTQDANGNVTDTVPDGQTDWVFDTKGDWSAAVQYRAGDYAIDATNGSLYQALGDSKGIALSTAASWTNSPGTPPPHRIRWYGMPRDAIGTESVQGYSTTHTVNEMVNVVPLLDVWRSSANNVDRPLPYEVETGPTLGMPTGATASTDYYNAMGSLAPPRYTAVWQNSTPEMVRVLLKLDDSNNELPSGPWFEYVFRLR